MSRVLSSVAALFALSLTACEPDQAAATKQGPPSDISEVGADCQSCLVDLAECTSTTKTEQQFSECRDLFQSCQADRQLAFTSCGSPSSQLACGLCQGRLSTCKVDSDDDGVCGAEFDTCRQLLIRSSAFTCSPKEDEPADVASCDDCLRELASCAAGGDEASVCQNGFAACRDLADLGDGCDNPTDSQACELCDAQVTTCNAQSDEATCAAGRASCVAQLASTPDACPPPAGSGDGGGSGEGGATGEGGGDEGGASGEGGSDSTTGGGTCDYDACAEGDSPDAACNACTSEVCAADAFCCDGAWDATCVSEAAAVASCGCAADTCAHDVCETGDLLEASCNDCATTVCAEDDYCCTVSWDTTCTELAAQTCGCGV